jgi:hypothetical protein
VSIGIAGFVPVKGYVSRKEGGRNMTKWMVLTAMAVVIALAGSSLAYDNANGIGYFALEVPADVKITVDGLDNDWQWFDMAYIVGPDQMAATVGGEVPPKDDIDIAIKAGWTAATGDDPGKLLVFVRVVDDMLNIDVTEGDAGWQDDDMEIILDVDHSGTYHSADDASGGGTRTDMQQWTFHVATPGGYPQTAHMRYQQIPEMQWAITEGYVEAATNVTPKAEHLATDVVVGYEIRMPAWDFYSPDGFDASTPHLFEAGQTLGMSVTLNEADDGGRSHQISTHPVEAGAHDSDFTSEFTLLSVEEYTRAVAVESSSWGAVKALFR